MSAIYPSLNNHNLSVLHLRKSWHPKYNLNKNSVLFIYSPPRQIPEPLSHQIVSFTKPLLLGNAGIATVSKPNPLLPAARSQHPSTGQSSREQHKALSLSLHSHHVIPPNSLPSDPREEASGCTVPSHPGGPRAILGARVEKVHRIALRLQVARPLHFSFLTNRFFKADPKQGR